MTIVAHSQATQMMFYNFVANNVYYKQSVNLLVALGPIAVNQDISPTN